MKLTKSRISTH